MTLAGGTEESRRRLVAGLRTVWPTYAELSRPTPVETLAAEQRFGVDPAVLADEVDAVVEHVLATAGLERPDLPPSGTGAMGRNGRHTEEMGRLLAEMQVVARAHPRGKW